VYCIEAGGSGQVLLNNFDHHDPEHYYPPACRQAFVARGMADAGLSRLVDYVCMVDDRLSDLPHIPFPSLSSIFSGMRFDESSVLRQFNQGIALLRYVREANIDPFDTMPDLAQWRTYRQVKEDNMAGVNNDFQKVIFFQSASGRKVGFSEFRHIGGIGGLYKEGCEAVIMHNNAFGDPSIRKFTISGNGIKVSHLLPFIEPLEAGWGGRETIIGSPYEGSKLSKEQIIELVRKYL